MKRITTCNAIDVIRARAAFGETPYEQGPDGFIRPQEGWDIAKKMRLHDEALGLNIDDLLAVLNGDAVIVRKQPQSPECRTIAATEG